MKVVFYASDKPREHMLANALAQGVVKAGDQFEIRRTADYGEDRHYEGPSPDTDMAVCFGVKGKSRDIIEEHLAMGRLTLNLDKGLSRQKGEGGHTEYSRIAINGKAPRDVMRAKTDGSRVRVLGMRTEDRRGPGGHILICGSSEKYHEFHRLAAPTSWAEKMHRTLRQITGRQIVFRPKPSDRGARPIPGMAYSHGSSALEHALRGCHALITHGSSAGLAASLAGIPVWCGDENILSPIAEPEIANIDEPFFPDKKLRARWVNAVTFYQWSNKELRDGSAYEWIREEARRLAK